MATDFVMADAPKREAMPKDGEYWGLQRLKRAYTSYLSDKAREIDEQKEARRYYHGSQWTSAQIAELRRRRQPVMTFNRVARKINGVVGVIERQRQDPKAYPRTPQHEQGAQLATATLRYVLDEQDWKAKSPVAALDGSVDGLAGIGLIIEDGDQGDKEIGFDNVDPDSFFYDPRSFKPDFSDARYMGEGKWVLHEVIAEQFPDVEVMPGSGDELSSNSDRDNKWYSSNEDGGHRIRLVECWYIHRGEWCWALFTGSQILMEGKSYLKDQKGKTFCRFIMYSAAIDQDGDRYGFVRHMRSAQDSLNAKQSKMHHILASQRLIMRQGAVEDVEKTRREWSRPDGVVILPPSGNPLNQDIQTDNQSADFAGWAAMLQLAIAEMENFGPNPALLGEGGENQSGRAIQLLQQAGFAELGPYMLAYRGWKVRVYRAIWNALQHHWSGERWVRVTDDEGLAQFIQINGTGIDPTTGQPVMVNALGSLDVDIILDEGPDTITQMQDNYEILMAMGPDVPAPIKIEMSTLAPDVKKKLLGMFEQIAQQPNPEAQKLEAEMALKQQDAQLQTAKAQADIQAKAVDLQLKRESAAADIQLKREEAAAEMQIEAARAEQAMRIERMKAENQIMTAREKALVQNGLAAERARQADPVWAES